MTSKYKEDFLHDYYPINPGYFYVVHVEVLDEETNEVKTWEFVTQAHEGHTAHSFGLFMKKVCVNSGIADLSGTILHVAIKNCDIVGRGLSHLII